MIALLIGVLLSLLLPERLDAKVYSATGWPGESLLIAAPIILITGAGGIFGAMLQNSGFAALITESFSGMSIGLFFPFLLAACLKTTQGSSTVALITTAFHSGPNDARSGARGCLYENDDRFGHWCGFDRGVPCQR